MTRKLSIEELVVKMYNLGRAYERMEYLFMCSKEAMPPQNGSWKIHVAELGHIRDLMDISIEEDD